MYSYFYYCSSASQRTFVYIYITYISGFSEVFFSDFDWSHVNYCVMPVLFRYRTSPPHPTMSAWSDRLVNRPTRPTPCCGPISTTSSGRLILHLFIYLLVNMYYNTKGAKKKYLLLYLPYRYHMSNWGPSNADVRVMAASKSIVMFVCTNPLQWVL